MGGDTVVEAGLDADRERGAGRGPAMIVIIVRQIMIVTIIIIIITIIMIITIMMIIAIILRITIIIVTITTRSCFPEPVGEVHWEQGPALRPISLLRLSLLRFVDTNFLEIPYGHENSTPEH